MWLRMDHPTNLMMITGVLFFDRPLDRSAVVGLLRERLLDLPRFAERVVLGQRGARHHWQACADVDMDWHVQDARLPSPGSDAELREFVSRWMSTPLDMSRPLWQTHLIDNYRQGSVMMWRLHHCIGDGIALMLALLSLSELDRSSGDHEENPLRALFGPDPLQPEVAKRYLHRVLPEAVKLLTLPAERMASLTRWQRGGASVPAFGRLALRPPDARTPFKGPLGTGKRAAWSEPIPMTQIAAVRQALGGTVNDILTNAVAGGLRRYLEARGELRERLNIRAVVPVNLRPLDEMNSLGNQFGLIFLSLPVGIADTRRRLVELQRRMKKLKRSFEPVVAMRIMSALGSSPRQIQDLVVRIFGAKGTAVLTNVPGPTARLELVGEPIAGFMFWVPQSARLGMGISILSYAGQVRVGIATDEGLVPDPEKIVSGLQLEFDAMQQLAAAVRST